MQELKNKDIVLTPQRLAVWNFMKENSQHPCVEGVYVRVRKQFPSISLATVYSILQTFRSCGLLKELSIRKDKTCFDPSTEPHHHLLCKACDKIYDVEVVCGIAKAGKISGHKIESVHGYFYGICKNCLGRKR